MWWMEHLHSSSYITTVAGATILGVVASSFINEGTFNSIVWLYGACILLACLFIRKLRIGIVGVVLAGLLIGLWRGSAMQTSLNEYDQFYNTKVIMEGVVSEDTSLGKKGETRLRLHKVQIEDDYVGGEVWVTLRDKTVSINRSDTIRIEGTLMPGFGNFVATMFKAEIIDVTRTSQNDLGLILRDAFSGRVSNVIAEPELSLGLGYLLGLKSALPENLSQQIQILGLTHVVVASGYNLTILVSFARRIFSAVSKYLAGVIGSGMIIGFMSITGLSPSMSRAGLVASLSLLAWYYGRKFHPVSLLIFSATCTVLYKPSYVWGDIGWYLSFGAFFGVLVLAPLIHHYFWGSQSRPGIIRELLIATLSAQLMTLPIILSSFGAYSMFALLANVLVLPVVPLAMLATFIAGLASLVVPFWATFFAIPAEVLLHYCTFIIGLIAGLPNAKTEYELSGLGVGVSYVILLVFVLFLLKKTNHNFMKDKTIID